MEKSLAERKSVQPFVQYVDCGEGAVPACHLSSIIQVTPHTPYSHLHLCLLLPSPNFLVLCSKCSSVVGAVQHPETAETLQYIIHPPPPQMSPPLPRRRQSNLPRMPNLQTRKQPPPTQTNPTQPPSPNPLRRRSRRVSERVSPRMLKSLVGARHAEFAGMKQQDVREFLIWLISRVQCAGKASGKVQETLGREEMEGVCGGC